MAVYRVGERFQVMCKRNAKNETIRKWHAVFMCSCGTRFISRCEDIKDESVQSCGCERLRKAKLRATGNKYNVTHGKTKTREYKIWSMMKERCLKKTHKSYLEYGGRGISICAEWVVSFEAFLRDMGKCEKGFSIERIDVNGNYEKSNCKWATQREQNRNKRTNVVIVIDGERKIAIDWAQEPGAYHLNMIYKNVKNGKCGRDAVFKKVVQ